MVFTPEAHRYVSESCDPDGTVSLACGSQGCGRRAALRWRPFQIVIVDEGTFPAIQHTYSTCSEVSFSVDSVAPAGPPPARAQAT